MYWSCMHKTNSSPAHLVRARRLNKTSVACRAVKSLVRTRPRLSKHKQNLCLLLHRSCVHCQRISLLLKIVANSNGNCHSDDDGYGGGVMMII